jgi:hypothetical protein
MRFQKAVSIRCRYKTEIFATVVWIKIKRSSVEVTVVMPTMAKLEDDLKANRSQNQDRKVTKI